MTKSMRRLQNAIPAYSYVLICIYYACIFYYAIVGYKTPAKKPTPKRTKIQQTNSTCLSGQVLFFPIDC